MNQNESQGAAAERAIPTWQERAASDPTRWSKSSPVRFMQAEIDDLRAALKAQPAPTEAPRPDMSKFVTVEEWQVAMSQWSLNKALGKGSTEAQGELNAAAAAVVARWYTPKWKDEPHTAVLIDRLRKALDGAPVAQGEDSARLDSLHDQMVDTIYMDDGRVIDVGGKHLNNLRKAIDGFLARASAETGGVKS